MSFNFSEPLWIYPKEDPEWVQKITEELNIHPVTAQILVSRGFSSIEDINNYLYAKLPNLYDPDLFREILALALERYDEDRATYHVSAVKEKVPRPDELSDDELAGVLDLFDGREVLHVTFGSMLDQFGDRLVAALEADEEAHYAALEAHFVRHLTPFIK